MVSLRAKLVVIFMVVELRTEACSLTSRLFSADSQSKRSIELLIWSELKCWKCHTVLSYGMMAHKIILNWTFISITAPNLYIAICILCTFCFLFGSISLLTFWLFLFVVIIYFVTTLYCICFTIDKKSYCAYS